MGLPRLSSPASRAKSQGAGGWWAGARAHASPGQEEKARAQNVTSTQRFSLECLGSRVTAFLFSYTGPTAIIPD